MRLRVATNTADERRGKSQGHGTGFFEASEFAQGSFVDEEEGHVRSIPKLDDSTATPGCDVSFCVSR